MRDIEEFLSQVCYKTFTEFCQRLTRLKSLCNWNIIPFPDRVVLKQMTEPYLLPKFEILVDDCLGSQLTFMAVIYQWTILPTLIIGGLSGT